MPSKKLSSGVFLQNKVLIPFFIGLSTLIIGFLGGIGYTRYSSSQYPSKAMVTRVIDGDTIELDSGKTFRLYAVACPDANEPYYQEAKDFAEDKVAGKKVNLEYEPNYQEDKYDRLLGYVFVDEENLNVELVRNGLCKVMLYSKRAKLIYQDELVEAENTAKQEKIGLWEK